VLEVGDRISLEARVWLAPNEPVIFREIIEDGAVLLLFYLFDWTGT
jgi:hypothetical protein